MPQQPMYQQIADDLRKRIELGAALPPVSDDPAAHESDGQLPAVLRPGARLPTEAGLSEAYSASRNTIRDAIKRLTNSGLVETRPGRGTFATRRIDPFVTVLSTDPLARRGAEGATYLSDVSSNHRQARVSVPKVEIQVPPLEVGRQLRVAQTAQVISRHQLRYVDNIPLSLQTSDWITVRRPDLAEQTFFEMAHDGTVFEIFRTAFDQTGTPLRVRVTVFPTDRNQFIINVGDVPDPSYEVDEASESA